MKVSHDGPPEPASGRKWIPRILRTTSLSMSTPKARATCWAIRLQPHVRLRRFISTTASITSLVGPLGPGRRARLDEKSRRYFCFVSILWKCSRVDGFKATADRKTRAGRISSMHKPTIMRSEARRLGPVSDHDSESGLGVASRRIPQQQNRAHQVDGAE